MINISLNNEELQALGVLLDAAVKAGGMAAAKAAVPLFEKLEKAVAEFNAANAANNPAQEEKEAA